MPQKVEISARTIIFTAFFLLGLIFLWQIKDLIFSLLIAFIIAGALKPARIFLEKRKISPGLAAFFIYIVFVFSFFYILSLIIPPLAFELIHLSRNLPEIIKAGSPYLYSFFNIDFVFKNIPGLANQTIDFIKNIFSNIIFFSSTLFFGFYFLREKNLPRKLLGSFFEEKEISRIEIVSERAQKKMSSWFWGEIVLMVVVGSLIYIGLIMLKIKYALALAVLAGLLEVIPSFGPIVSTVPAFLIASSQSIFFGFSVILLYFIVQQLENNLIVPQVMKKATGLNPIIILISLVIGGKLAGILGVLLAVPTTILLETVIIEWQKFRGR